MKFHAGPEADGDRILESSVDTAGERDELESARLTLIRSHVTTHAYYIHCSVLAASRTKSVSAWSTLR